MKLFLFDIDGTLLIGRSNIYRDPLNRAGREVFGDRFRIELTDRLGSLDAHITDEAIELAGATSTPESVAEYRRRYFEYLAEAVPSGTVLPGAVELLDELEGRPDAALGLVTGNYRESARLKIDGLGLRWERFRVGGFGDRKTTRADLVREAIEEGEKSFGVAFPPENVFVIGDTLKDIACARENGCKVIAVASGWTDRETLASGRPDLLLDDLTDRDLICSFCFSRYNEER